jgi:uncharacterized paraquat-inducible protein A
MTPLHLIKIDLEEISALDVTCPDCGSVMQISVPIQNLSTSVSCIGCNRSLWEGKDHPAHQLVGQVLKVLNSYRENHKLLKFSLGFSLVDRSQP